MSISPDGGTLAWTYDGKHGSELHLTPVAASPSQGAAADRVISPDTITDAANHAPGACTASHPNWSPDGKQLAFLSNCSENGGKFQPTSPSNIFVWTLSGNAIKQVSNLHGAVSSIQWSPDGRSIGFLYVEGATRRAGALDAMKPWSGVIGEDGVEIQRIYAVDVEHATGGYVSPTNLHAYEFAWGADSKHLSFVAAPPPGENTWWIAKLYIEQVIGAITFAGPDHPIYGYSVDHQEVLLDPQTISGPLHGLQIAVPRFSPDGKQIAFIGGLMSDQGSVGGDIYLIPAAGGEPKDITPNRAASPAYIGWINDHYLGVSEHVGGSSHITAIDVNSGKDLSMVNLTLPETIVSGVDVMSISIAPKSRKIALIRQSFERPPEVWAGPISDLKQITHLNDAIKPSWARPNPSTTPTRASTFRAGCSIRRIMTPQRNIR